MADYLDVLVLSSDPVNLRRTLSLDREMVHFEQVIRRSELPIRLRRVFPPTLEQLQREFARAAERGRQPSVFHFLGHGDDDGLYFENEHGEAQLVKGRELKAALAQSPVKVALLNACWSATKRGVSLIEFLTREQVADAAIGHETPVADVSAIEFARQFYSLITQGKTVRDACLRARNSLAEQGKFGAKDVKLVGNGELVLTAGLLSGSRPCVIESGLPKFGHLPEPPVFYGRGEELVQLSRSLADPGLTGFGLWGIGGIGKTALATVAARRNAWRYEGAVWVDIRDATQKTTAELLRLALCRLHPGAPDADPAFELARRLQAAPSLIVLDNLEDLPEFEHAALARFLQQVPKNGSRVLLTDRVPLPAVERLSDVHSRCLTEGLDTWNGAHFVQHVARQKKCEALRDELREEGSNLEGLCVLVTQRLHGHPKMLELAVGVALQGRKQLEQALVAIPDDLEQQLAALLATSLQCLGDDGNRVLPLLSFFPTGNLTPDALDIVGSVSNPSISEETDEDAEPELLWLTRGREQLVAAGLLEYDQTRDVYTFHQAILEKAYRCRPSVQTCSAATTALLLHFAEYVRANQSDNTQLDRCFETALVLMESLWSQRGGDIPNDAVLADMTDSLGTYFHQRGLWVLGEQWQRRAIELRRSSNCAQNEAALAVEWFQLGRILAAKGDFGAAREALNESFMRNEQAGNRQAIGTLMHELASIEWAQGNANEARRLLQSALANKESRHDQQGLSASMQLLASIELAKGNPREARALLQRSITIDESLGDNAMLSSSLHQLAILERNQGNPSETRRLLQRSLAITQSLGDQKGLAASLHELAIVERVQGNPSEARRLLQRSLAIKESLGDQRGQAASLNNLAVLEFAQGNPNEARALLKRSIAIKETLGSERDLAMSIYELARVELAQGNPDESRRLLERALAINDAMGDQLQKSASLHELGNVEIKTGNRRAARQLWEHSIRITESIGHVEGAAVTRYMLAQIEAIEGRFERAIDLASQSVRELEQLGYAQAEQARNILQLIQECAAQAT